MTFLIYLIYYESIFTVNSIYKKMLLHFELYKLIDNDNLVDINIYYHNKEILIL